MGKSKVISTCFKQGIVIVLIVCIFPTRSHEKLSELIYILQWTYAYELDWSDRYLGKGQGAFTSRNCTFQNCFITSNRTYFENIADYDIVLFNVIPYIRFPSQKIQLPPVRSENQQYLLLGVEPAAYNRVPGSLNGIINLTWTYKLDSDIVHPYFTVKNHFGQRVGPKIDKYWLNINDLPPVNNSIMQKLKNKRLAAVWIGSNCYSKNRIIYIIKLQNELKSKYGLQLDIFGKCGDESACMKDPTDRDGLLTKCYDKIESDYYFYLAFENSNSEDYVSEKVLHGLNHFTVPVVYGGADYTRFLPDGIYLDAIKLGVEGLAKEMYDIINDPPRYYDFFKWHGYYTFHDSGADNYSYTVCELCAFLNNEQRQINRTVRVYDNIVNWWNVPATETFPNNFSFRYYINESISPIEEPQTVEQDTVVSKVLNFLFDF